MVTPGEELVFLSTTFQRLPLHIPREVYEIIPAAELVIIQEADDVVNIDAVEILTDRFSGRTKSPRKADSEVSNKLHLI